MKQAFFFRLLILSTLFLVPNACVKAQTPTTVRVKAHIINKYWDEKNKETKRDNLPDEEVYYGVFHDKATADAALKYAKEHDGKPLEKYKQYCGVSLIDGSFETPAFINGYIYVLSNDFEGSYVIPIKEDNSEYTLNDPQRTKVVLAKKRRNKEEVGFENQYYEVYLEVNRLAGAEKVSKTKPKPRTGGTIRPRRHNGTEIFPIYIYRDSTYLRNSTRLIIQTYAVDCTTEDTVALCEPIVLENSDYHELQDKRKNFDYFECDPLGKGYQGNIVNGKENYTMKQGEPLLVDTSIEFVKPKGMEKRHFKGPYKVSLEDYHHVIDSFMWDGTCLSRDAWKFLNYGNVYGEIPLTKEEFYEEPKIQINNVSRSLGLLYVRGKDILRDTPENDSIKDELLKVLRAFDVLNPKIVGYSSPEGGYQGNLDLARRRGQQAANLIRKNCAIEPKVATWGDVARELDEMRHPEEANAIRQYMSESKDSLYGTDIGTKAKGLSTYQDVVEPALERLRKMEFHFGYIDSRPMTPREIVKHYMKNKKYFLSHDSICRYSNGDFFNLYYTIKDSVEHDTITMIAYEKLSLLSKDFWKQKFAPYVINRMALLKIKEGKPDSTILRPLINLSTRVIDQNWRPSFVSQYTIKMNRKEVLQNQALTMFLLDNINEADTLLTWIKEQNKADATVMRFIRYVDLLNFEGMDRTPEEEERYQAAKNSVLASNANKAILYSELPEWEKVEEARNKWIDLMDDKDPKKWYLKGIAWASSAGKEKTRSNVTSSVLKFQSLPQEVLDSLKINDNDAYRAYIEKLNEYKQEVKEDEETKDVDVSKIPYYLAYFQHCFDIDKSENQTYKRYYFDEGLVDDDTRKLYPYKRENIPAYRKLFRMLKRYDDGVRDVWLKRGEKPIVE